LTINTSPIASVSPDITITSGNSTTLTATGFGTYNWSPSSGLSSTSGASVIATPTQTTTYCVEVTNTSGCKDTACVTVKVDIKCSIDEKSVLPNAFSPNNDGANDEFCMPGWDNCLSLFEIKIYNRWGDLLYQSLDPSFCWDGVSKGTKLDAQVFVYYINAITISGDIIHRTGNISLIR